MTAEPAPRPRQGRTGRRPGASGAREAILEAARFTFAASGYERATIRAIAGRAGVDPALVHHYFGSKDELLRAAVAFPFEPAAMLPAVLADRSRVGWSLAEAVFTLWERPEVRERIVALLRTAASHETAAAVLRALVEREVLGPIAASLDLPDAGLRAALAGTQIVGIALGRFVVGVAPLPDVPIERIVAAIGPVLQHYLTGDLGSPPDPAGPPESADPEAPRGYRTSKPATPPSRVRSRRSAASSKPGEA